MPRPKTADPRSELLRLRLTPAEKAAIEASASAVGANVSEFVRSRALGVSVVEQARVGSRGGPVEGSGSVAGSRDVAGSSPVPPAPAEPSMPDRRDPAAWWCPTPLCQKRSLRKGELCATHGIPMTMLLKEAKG